MIGWGATEIDEPLLAVPYTITYLKTSLFCAFDASRYETIGGVQSKSRRGMPCPQHRTRWSAYPILGMGSRIYSGRGSLPCCTHAVCRGSALKLSCFVGALWLRRRDNDARCLQMARLLKCIMSYVARTAGLMSPPPVPSPSLP